MNLEVKSLCACCLEESKDQAVVVSSWEAAGKLGCLLSIPNPEGPAMLVRIQMESSTIPSSAKIQGAVSAGISDLIPEPYFYGQEPSCAHGCFYPDVTRLGDDGFDRRLLFCIRHGFQFCDSPVGRPLEMGEIPTPEWRARERLTLSGKSAQGVE